MQKLCPHRPLRTTPFLTHCLQRLPAADCGVCLSRDFDLHAHNRADNTTLTSCRPRRFTAGTIVDWLRATNTQFVAGTATALAAAQRSTPMRPRPIVTAEAGRRRLQTWRGHNRSKTRMRWPASAGVGPLSAGLAMWRHVRGVESAAL